jgi:hypothetical protein
VIVVDGRPFMAVAYRGELLDGTLGLFVPPERREDLAWLYHRLTGIAAPTE